MKRTLSGLALALASLFAHADTQVLARFDGGIGSQPFASVNGAAVPNDVLGVLPGGRPWLIGDLKARVDVGGDIRVTGKGLVLAGGNSIGRPGLPRQVAATLFCGGVASTSPAVDVDASGDFTIRGALSPTPASPCANSILLIRNFAAGAAGAWFAAGIPVED